MLKSLISTDALRSLAEGGSEAVRAPARSLLAEVFDIIVRRSLIVVGCVALSIVLAIGYLWIAEAMFTATSTVMIDTLRPPPYATDRAGAVDESFIETQIEELGSDMLRLEVIDKLRIWEDSEFVGDEQNYLAKIARVVIDKLWQRKDVQVSGEDKDKRREIAIARREAVLERLRRAERVQRVGKSYIVNISFTLPDPNKAATLANALAETYIANRAVRLKQIGDLIEKRTLAMSDRTQAAFRAVEAFRAKHNVFVDSRGKLTSERELEGLARSLDLARAETSHKQGKLKPIEAILQKNIGVDSADPFDLVDTGRDSLGERGNFLRRQYLDAVNQAADLEARFGQDNAEAIRMRKRSTALKDEIWSEVKQLAQLYAEKVAAAKARERVIENRVTDLFEQTASAQQDLAKLKELETQAQAYKTVYETYLKQQIQNIERTVLPVSSARLLLAATPPLRKSSPKTGLILLLSSLMGAMLGVAGAFAREHFDDVIRRPEQIERDLGLQCLGLVPAHKVKRGGAWLTGTKKTLVMLEDDRMPSQARDTLLNIKLAVDQSPDMQNGHAVGIASPTFGEGKATLAYNLAVCTAAYGRSTLLIDGDLHHRSLMRSLAPDSDGSLVAVLGGTATLGDSVNHVDLGFDLLGEPPGSVPIHSARHLESSQMKELLVAARQTYDYVWIDLPSMLEHVDVRASAGNLDTLILVAKWGRTRTNDLARALRSSKVVAARVIGVVINESPTKSTSWL